jgi:tRNA pseudouridine32 synthase/23S rRNA pseudouridine746 synthase
MPRKVFTKTISEADPDRLLDLLHLLTGLSRTKLKDAMSKGAVWIRRPGGKKRRIRRARATVRTGDSVWLYYDPDILSICPPEARLELDRRSYSIWYKPSGLMSQGSPFGDHCALPRQVEKHFAPERDVRLTHRLDREVAGLILVAHTKHAAARLSEMLQTNRIDKRYHAHVRGDLRSSAAGGEISFPLDGRPANTTYTCLSYDESRDISAASIRIATGRLHQIRRHFDLIGHPVMGDPRYGRNNSDPSGLQLTAYSLSFNCPFSGDRINLSFDIKEKTHFTTS